MNLVEQEDIEHFPHIIAPVEKKLVKVLLYNFLDDLNLQLKRKVLEGFINHPQSLRYCATVINFKAYLDSF